MEIVNAIFRSGRRISDTEDILKLLPMAILMLDKSTAYGKPGQPLISKTQKLVAIPGHWCGVNQSPITLINTRFARRPSNSP
jgi:hypothetical protein